MVWVVYAHGSERCPQAIDEYTDRLEHRGIREVFTRNPYQHKQKRLTRANLNEANNRMS